MPLKAAHDLDVSRQRRVGRDDKIGAADLLAPLAAVEPMPNDEPQIRGEFCRLRHPIGDKACWYDDERRRSSLPAARSTAICARVCAVFPNPISSARMPAMPLARK